MYKIDKNAKWIYQMRKQKIAIQRLKLIFVGTGTGTGTSGILTKKEKLWYVLKPLAFIGDLWWYIT